MTYAVPADLCESWRRDHPAASPAEIARRDGHPFGRRTVRKHVNFNCSHPTPSVDYDTCYWWRRYADRDGAPEDHGWDSAEETARRDDVQHPPETIERHQRLECDHDDRLGYPPMLPKQYDWDALMRLHDLVEMDDGPVSLAEADALLDADGG